MIQSETDSLRYFNRLLVGRSRSGKTPALLHVISLLEQRPGAEFLQRQTTWPNDVIAIIVIGKIKLGVITNGDPEGDLEGDISRLIEEGCQIIICACRVRMTTRDVVWGFKASHDIFEIKQEYADDSDVVQAQIRDKKAAEILHRVDKLLFAITKCL